MRWNKKVEKIIIIFLQLNLSMDVHTKVAVRLCTALLCFQLHYICAGFPFIMNTLCDMNDNIEKVTCHK
jgi:hypothetical protein